MPLDRGRFVLFVCVCVWILASICVCDGGDVCNSGSASDTQGW